MQHSIFCHWSGSARIGGITVFESYIKRSHWTLPSKRASFQYKCKKWSIFWKPVACGQTIWKMWKIEKFKCDIYLYNKSSNLSVCPSARISPEPLDLWSWNFACVIYTSCERFLWKKISKNRKKKFWRFFFQNFFSYFLSASSIALLALTSF